jgi:hypothetical protein
MDYETAISHSSVCYQKMAEVVYLVTALSEGLLLMMKHSRNPCIGTTTEDPVQKFVVLGLS